MIKLPVFKEKMFIFTWQLRFNLSGRNAISKHKCSLKLQRLSGAALPGIPAVSGMGYTHSPILPFAWIFLNMQ